MWSVDEILRHCARSLTEQASRADAEQAVRGIDALAELDIHPILQNGLEAAGFGLWPEHPYPGQPQNRPQHRERERCDLVLVEEPGLALADPLAAVLERDQLEQTLFAGLADERPNARAVGPDDAFWLEVKVVGQYSFVENVPGPNRSYSSQLVQGPATDIAKLARDEMICHGAVLLVLFTESEEVAKHDLNAMVHRCLDKDLPVSAPIVEHFEITDRIGNRCCSVALIRVRGC